MEELANDELKKQEFRVRAQAHEYMYEILKQNTGGSVTLDNSIGSAFFNTRADITQQDMTFENLIEKREEEKQSITLKRKIQNKRSNESEVN